MSLHHLQDPLRKRPPVHHFDRRLVRPLPRHPAPPPALPGPDAEALRATPVHPPYAPPRTRCSASIAASRCATCRSVNTHVGKASVASDTSCVAGSLAPTASCVTAPGPLQAGLSHTAARSARIARNSSSTSHCQAVTGGAFACRQASPFTDTSSSPDPITAALP